MKKRMRLMRLLAKLRHCGSVSENKKLKLILALPCVRVCLFFSHTLASECLQTLVSILFLAAAHDEFPLGTPLCCQSPLPCAVSNGLLMFEVGW